MTSNSGRLKVKHCFMLLQKTDASSNSTEGTKACLMFSVLPFDDRDFASLILHTKTSLFVSIKV